MNPTDRSHFQTFGFTVLRSVIDADRLRDELDLALRESRASAIGVETGSGTTRVEYVPMMCERTPFSLSLLDRFETYATQLIEAPVLPIRAKGMRYIGSTPWHTDSSRDAVISVGFAAYLEPLDADHGALRVLPGSHRAPMNEDTNLYLANHGVESAVDALPGYAVCTEPGDVIVFDEHLYHASSGGTSRRQWRVDYVRVPQTEDERAGVCALLATVFAPEWDGGFDVDRFPSYGPAWHDSARKSVALLGALGAYELAAAQEAYARSRRR